MSYKIIPTPEFKKVFKKLSKKYPSLKNDLIRLSHDLAKNPAIGISLGNNLYKVRMAITSKGKGKSGGARVITFLITDDKEVYLVYIYDKSQLDNLSKDEVVSLLREAQLT